MTVNICCMQRIGADELNLILLVSLYIASGVLLIIELLWLGLGTANAVYSYSSVRSTIIRIGD